MPREYRLSHLGIRCGDIITTFMFASSNFVVQVVFERFEDVNDNIADRV